jgi:hypothetical protein
VRVLVALAVVPVTAFADEFATSPARPDYMATEKLLMWKGRGELEERGVVVDGTYAVELFAAPQLDDKLAAGGLFTLELDLDFRKLVSKHLGDAHVSAFGIHGHSITEELMDIHGTSGNAAPQDVRLFEAWIDQPLGPIATLRAGLLAVDQEFVLADHSGTLLGATFGMTSQFSVHAFGPVYPIAAPGASTRVEVPGFSARAGIYDGTQSNDHGIPSALGPAYLVVGELEIAKIVKLGAWHHEQYGDAAYAIADAELAGDKLGAFARVGISEGPVDFYADAGVRAAARGDDFISFGLAFSRLDAGSETAFEATYESQLAWFTIQPDFQLHLLRDRAVAMFATRMTVTF